MIPAEYQTLLFVYITAWLLTIAVLWAREVWRQNIFDRDLSKNRLWRCEKCHFTFLVKGQESITRCPRCNNICILRKRRGV
jgi:uncharacterized paraquat-inducible protein A